MYHWINNKVFLKQSYSYCADIVNRLVQNLKKYGIETQMSVVGSKSRNMITQNEKEDIDYDFNLMIENASAYTNAALLKQRIQRAFNEVLSSIGEHDCEASTSALTTKRLKLRNGNKTGFHIDVCIVKEDGRGLHRLIHKKTDDTRNDSYIWNLVPNSRDLREKEELLKPYYWNSVREAYIAKKNLHLKRQEVHSHPSFVSYIEAVNEIYDNHVRELEKKKEAENKEALMRRSEQFGWCNPYMHSRSTILS